MSKNLLHIIYSLLLLVSCTNNPQDQQFTLSCNTSNIDLEGDKVYLYALSSNFEAVSLDSTKIINGQFHFEGFAPLEPTNIFISIIDNTTGNPEINRSLILEAGDIEVTIDSNYIVQVHGTPLNEMSFKCAKAMLEYQDSCELIAQSNMNAENKHKALSEIQNIRNEKILDAILPNINYAVTLDLISEHYTLFNNEQLNMMYEALDHNQKVMEKARDFRNTMIESVVGQTLGYVEIPDRDSNKVVLQDILKKHDYILLDFWASWCGPCKRNLTEIKTIYSTFKGDRFEVVAVSLDDNKEKWLNAVDKLSGGWIDVSYLDGWNCSLAKRLKVDFVPATILLDSTGTIISRNPSITELKIILDK